jgi:hypothetical protein
MKIRNSDAWRMCLVVHLFSVLLIILSFVGFKTVHAQEKNISFDAEKEIISNSQEINLFVHVNQKITGVDSIVIDYPEEFHLNMDKIQDANSNEITKIMNNQEEHQLLFSLKENQSAFDLNITGNFSKSGTYSLSATYAKESATKEITVKTETATSGNEEPQRETSNSKENEEVTENSIEAEASEDKANEPEVKAAVPDFDWNLLNNDGLDLSTFTKVDVNTPVKLTGGLFDKQERMYFLFLGHVSGAANYNYETEKFSAGGDVLSSMSTSVSTPRPILSPAFIGVKKRVGNEKTGSIVDHSFDRRRSTMFDIGEINNSVGSIKYSESYMDKNLMISEYVKNNELVAYGFIGRVDLDDSIGAVVDYQPVRIHGYVTDYKSGRIRYDVSYYNSQSSVKDYVMTYGLHVDIGGAHTNSKLFSNGQDGIYFDEESVPKDKIGEVLYFHMSGYEGTNGPSSYKVGNFVNYEPVGAWSQIDKNNRYWLYGPVKGWEDPLEQWDAFQPEGFQYPLSHPIFVYRWNPVSVPSGGIGTGSLDISIEEKEEVMPDAKKSYINTTTTDKKNHVGDILNFTLLAENKSSAKTAWSDVAIEDVLPEGLEVDQESFKLVNLEGTEVPLPSNVYNSETRTLKVGVGDISPGKNFKVKFDATISGKSGETIINTMKAANDDESIIKEADVDIPVEKRKITYEIKEDVFHKDGTHALTAKKGETLTYRATLKNPFTSEQDPQMSYKTLQLVVEKLDANLENFTELAFKDQKGNDVGKAIYDTNKHMIYGLFNQGSGASLDANQDIYLEYKATVKNAVAANTTILGQTTGNAILSDGTILPYTKSNQVETKVEEGALIFVSAPKQLDFGQDLVLSSMDKTYPIQERDTDLVVQDSRGEGNHWTMAATLTQELTSPTKHQLIGSLHYKNAGQDISLILGVSNLIYEKETKNDMAVNISEEWAGTDTGPVLQVQAGKAHAESYGGTIQWTLQDVPENQD